MRPDLLIPSIVATFIILIGAILFRKTKATFRLIHGPETVTTIGIAGTFAGITYALYMLDTTDVVSSLPSLLSGLKLAFAASFVGILVAVVIRLEQLFFGNARDENATDIDATTTLLHEIRALSRGIVGNEEGTLLTQIKLQRQENRDDLLRLQKSFDAFSQHIVENNQRAFIEALNKAISDFNRNLTEQFGENFKQLNAAVESLVIWQKQYKEQLDYLIVQQSKAADSMNVATHAYGVLVEKANLFTQVADQLNQTIPAMHHMTESLFVQSKSLAEVLGTMKDVTPTFAVKVDQMLQALQDGLRKVMESTGVTISGEVGRLTAQLNSDVSNLLASSKDSIINHTTQIQLTTAELKELLTNTIQNNQKLLTSNLEDSLSKIREGVTTLDRGLELELTKALESMSNQLGSLSAKFVDDYGPLTDRLREIVRLAERKGNGL